MLKDYVNFRAKISKIGIFGSRTFTATFGPKNGAESQKNISGPLGGAIGLGLVSSSN